MCSFFNDRLVVVGGMGTESMEAVPQVIRQLDKIFALASHEIWLFWAFFERLRD